MTETPVAERGQGAPTDYTDPGFQFLKEKRTPALYQRAYQNSAYKAVLSIPLDDHGKPLTDMVSLRSFTGDRFLLPLLAWSWPRKEVSLDFSCYLHVSLEDIPEFLEAIAFAERSARSIQDKLDNILRELGQETADNTDNSQG